MRSIIFLGLITLLLTVSNSALCPASNQCQTPTCPILYTFNGTTCVYTFGTGTTNPACPTGFTLQNGICISNNGSNNGGSNTSCGTGSYFNGLRCINITYSCVSGFVWKSNSCVFSGLNRTCKTGQIWNRISCINVPTCQANQYFNGARCVAINYVCPTGYSWNGQSCVNSNNPLPPITPIPPITSTCTSD